MKGMHSNAHPLQLAPVLLEQALPVLCRGGAVVQVRHVLIHHIRIRVVAVAIAVSPCTAHGISHAATVPDRHASASDQRARAQGFSTLKPF